MTRIVLILLASTVVAAAEPLPTSTTTQSFYGRNGSFAGSSSTHGNTTSLRNQHGQFGGGTVRNSDGTTSLYDARGHLTGSVINTSPR